ncbi:MAG: DUF885 domain-containing protein [Pseudomonadota bacterium]
MTISHSRVCFSILVLSGIAATCSLASCSHSPPTNAKVETAQDQDRRNADEQLLAIADRHAGIILKDAPEWASQLGVSATYGGEGFRARLSKFDPEALANTVKAQQLMISELRMIDREALSDRTKITFDVMLNAYELAEAQNRFGSGLPSVLSANAPYAVDQLFGPHISLPRLFTAQTPVRSIKDAENWLSRLAEVDRVLNELVLVTQRDAAQGVVPPHFALEAVAQSARSIASIRAADHPIATSFRARLSDIDGLSDAAKLELYERAITILETEVYPAFLRFGAEIELLIPKAGRDAGLWRLPRGAEMYRIALEAWGANGLTPEEIHQIGLDDVERIHGDMNMLLQDVGYRQGSVGERMAQLFKDPRYLIPNTDEAKADLVAKLQQDADSVLEIADEWFLTIPNYDVEVRRIPVHEQDVSSGGYYTPPPLDGSRPGIFWVNMKDSADIPVYTLKSLVFHEAVPGHHFQAGMALSVTDQPLIQNMMWFGDYGEGWALYTEELALEMGLYEGDPLGNLGRLRMELYRAARLVVDTGLHHKRWSRDTAIDYMVDVTGESRESIAREVERYAVWPGQAASYKLGMIQFQRLRLRAEDQLGEGFDLREFHDVVLRDGSMPMAVLEGQVDAWIASKQSESR